MIVDVAVAVLGDVRVEQKSLTMLHADVGLGDISMTLSEAFDLGALEHQAGLKGIVDGIIVARPPMAGDDLLIAA